MENSVTELLRRVSGGDRAAENDLIAQVYPNLHAMAKVHFRFERPEHTLQPTALVNEVYLKLIGDAPAAWKDRAHFFAVASRAMRQILTDYARRVNSNKRGNGARVIPLDEALVICEKGEKDCSGVLVLDEALEALEKVNGRLVQVVVYKHFGDMTYEEIGEVLGTSSRTVKRDWQFARAWLRDWLSR
jgi:RNA polymerase sigma factor (TIGR02999 family)